MSKGFMKLGFMVDGVGRSPADWRHPDMPKFAGTNFTRFKEQAANAERAKADMLLLADTVWSDPTSPPFRLDRFEAVTVLSALAAVTSRIGLLGTISSTFTAPYNCARQMLSLDHISDGRAGWNLVTSDPRGAGENFGLSADITHEERYKMAAEYVEVVKGLWDSFEDDALIQDKENDVFMTPGKLHTLNHKGKYFQVKGPLNLHRSVQGQPVIFTATASEDGINFASGSVDAMFTSATDLAENQEIYSKVKTRAKAHVRDPSQLIVMASIKVVVAETQDAAEALYAEQSRAIGISGALKFLNNFFTGVDLSKFELDAPFPLRLLEEHREGFQGEISRMVKAMEVKHLTLRELAMEFGFPKGIFVGSPTYIADVMQDWVEKEACDGFIMIETAPGQFRTFADSVIPILQERGLARTEYTGSTLREHLGLNKPENQFVVQQERLRTAS